MVFSSYTFIFVFLPLLFMVYFLIPKKNIKLKNIVLLLFSMIFYTCGGARYLPVLLISIGVNYIFSHFVKPGLKCRKLFTVLAVIFNISMLVWFKYTGFILENISKLGFTMSVPNIVLPIGISFFTFQGLSYVIDVSRGKVNPSKNILNFAMYISFFPQLIAGPIIRYVDIEKEIINREININNFTDGLMRFTYGLSKKIIIANQIGLLADDIFNLIPDNLTVVNSWLGTFAYTMQIYFDFSGYSDMAIGLGLIFGFHFMENFNYPYIADSVTDFWRRWHISLSSWFRDYLYIPLGGNRKGKNRQIFNLLVVWTLTGFWHGASWNFVVWGLYYAVLLICEKFIWGEKFKKINVSIKRVITFVIVMIGWVLFRSETLSDAIVRLKIMLGLSSNPFVNIQDLSYFKVHVIVLVLSIIFSFPIQKKLYNWLEKERIGKISLVLPHLISLGLLFICYVLLISSGFNPFIYFRF